MTVMKAVTTKFLLICVLCVSMSHGKPKPSRSGDRANRSSTSSNNIASLAAAFPDNSVPRDLINEPRSQSGNDGNHTVFILEGDIAVDYNSSNGQDQSSARYAVNNDWNVWPSGRIPYVIDGSLSFNANLIRRAMKHIMDNTCIVFTPRRNERDYIRIFRGGNRQCYSRIGRTGGSQTLSLGNGCLFHGVVVHELMHAIGFYHMHSRSDRDNYLTVLWGNIQGNMKGEFGKNSPRQNRIFGPFDYESIMLYGAKLFSWNGRDTMIARKRGVSLRDTAVKWGLSKYDAYNINQLYGCGNKRSYTPVKPKNPRNNNGINIIHNNRNSRNNRRGRRRG